MGGNVIVRLGHEEAGSNSGYVATILGGGGQVGYNRAVNETSRMFSKFLEKVHECLYRGLPVIEDKCSNYSLTSKCENASRYFQQISK